MWLATSILSAGELSDAGVGDLYWERWGIEGWFRSLKQTFSKRTMLSRTADRAGGELDWSILGLAMVQAHGVAALRAAGFAPHELNTSAGAPKLRAATAAERRRAQQLQAPPALA